MKRYGGDLTKAKRILFIAAIAIIFMSIPLIWSVDYKEVTTNFFSIPILWAYGLIFTPVILIIFINTAFKYFERANR